MQNYTTVIFSRYKCSSIVSNFVFNMLHFTPSRVLRGLYLAYINSSRATSWYISLRQAQVAMSWYISAPMQKNVCFKTSQSGWYSSNFQNSNSYRKRKTSSLDFFNENVHFHMLTLPEMWLNVWNLELARKKSTQFRKTWLLEN